MLPPEFLDHAPDKLVELFDQVEDDILRDMARRIAKMGWLTDTAEWQAWRYEQTKLVNSDALKKLSQMSGKSRKELWKILQESAAETLAQDDRIYNAAGLSVPESMSPTLKNILQSGYLQTGQAMDNFTATTANTVTREFENALDRAWLQINSGAFPYQQAIRQAVLSLAQDGLHSVTYPSGHRDSMEVAVRRAVLTGINQTAAKLQLARMDEMGCDLVETTAHGGARPEHAVWQGRVFSRSGKSRKYPDFVKSTGYGSGPGLCGWNCRHNFYPYFEGLSERNYSSADLAELNRRENEYRGKKYTRYEISQMQRRYEREIRQVKREYLALDAAGQDTTQAAVKLAKKRAAAKQFCREAGVRPDTFRQQVAGFGRSQAAKATAVARSYTKEQERAILIEKLRSAGNLPKSAQIHLTPTPIDVGSLGFDDAHVNQKRCHHVSELEAKQYIQDAAVSVTVWGGKFERYFSERGAAYVNTAENFIRTAYSAEEFDVNMQALIKELKANGLLG